ncbi:transposase, partial [Leptospirillum ferriphilum]|uniref:transposase n=1 Tax=Leptospirillum ferriphilum TaxID=178606 RepID=UPI0009C86B84
MSRGSAYDKDAVEIVATVQHRRRWSVSEKIRMMERPGMSVSFVARQNSIAPNRFFRRRKLVKEGGLSALKADKSVVGTSEAKQLKNRIRELERIL